MVKIYPVAMTVVPILGGVLVFTQADSRSEFILAALIMGLGILGGALFWWDARRKRD